MPAFSSDVYASTKEKPGDTSLDPYNRYLKQRSQAAQKWEGSPTAAPATTSLADQLNAEKQYRSGEYDRRQKGSEQQSQLAKAEDVRTGTVADRVRSALYDRQKAVSDLSTQQEQQDKMYGLQQKEAMQGWGQQVAEQNFKAFSNAAARYDALQDAYAKGIAEFQLLDAAKANSLQIADLDRYFEILTNDLKNKMQTMVAMSEYDQQIAMQEITNEAQGMGTFLEGLFKIGGQFAGEGARKGASNYKKYGSVWGK